MLLKLIGKIHLLKEDRFISYQSQKMVWCAFGILGLLKKKFLEMSMTSFGNLSYKLISSDKTVLVSLAYLVCFSTQSKVPQPSGQHLMRAIY